MKTPEGQSTQLSEEQYQEILDSVRNSVTQSMKRQEDQINELLRTQEKRFNESLKTQEKQISELIKSQEKLQNSQKELTRELKLLEQKLQNVIQLSSL